MFAKPKSKTELQRAVDRAMIELKSHDPTSEKYGVVLDRIAKLHKMQEDEKPDRMKPDTLVLVAANLLSIVMIIRHEHANVIASKALGFVKPRTSV